MYLKATDIDELMTDASVLMDALKIVSDIKKPIQINIGGKEWNIDFPNKKINKGKASSPELSVEIADADFAALQT